VVSETEEVQTSSRWTKGNGPATKFLPGQSGNPGGRPKSDLVALARQHTAAALSRIVQLMEQDEDRNIALSAATALLDRGWGKPPVAVFAQINGADADGVVRYEITWGSAKKSEAATIDAAAATDAEGEAEAQEVAYYWADGTRAG
jgi:hypothetical protein